MEIPETMAVYFERTDLSAEKLTQYEPKKQVEAVAWLVDRHFYNDGIVDTKDELRALKWLKEHVAKNPDAVRLIDSALKSAGRIPPEEVETDRKTLTQIRSELAPWKLINLEGVDLWLSVQRSGNDFEEKWRAWANPYHLAARRWVLRALALVEKSPKAKISPETLSAWKAEAERLTLYQGMVIKIGEILPWSAESMLDSETRKYAQRLVGMLEEHGLNESEKKALGKLRALENAWQKTQSNDHALTIGKQTFDMHPSEFRELVIRLDGLTAEIEAHQLPSPSLPRIEDIMNALYQLLDDYESRIPKKGAVRLTGAIASLRSSLETIHSAIIARSDS